MRFIKLLLIIIFLLMESCSANPKQVNKVELKSNNEESQTAEEAIVVNFRSEIGTTEHLLLKIKEISANASVIKIDYSIKNNSSEDIWICEKSNSSNKKPSRFYYETDIINDLVKISLVSPYITDYTLLYSKYKRVAPNKTENFKLDIIMPIVKLTTETGFYSSDDSRVLKSIKEIRQIKFSVGYYKNLKERYCAAYGKNNNEQYCREEMVGPNDMEIIYYWRQNNPELTVKTDIFFMNNEQ